MDSQVFDLSGYSRKRYTNTRGIRVEFAIIAIGLAITGLTAFAYQFTHGTIVSSFRVLYGLPYYFLFVGSGFLAWGSTRFAPGATLLQISPAGVTFRFPSKREFLLQWSDPRFSLNLVDARSTPLAQKYNIAGYAMVPHHPTTRLSSDALEALVAAAREHQISVTTRERGGRWSIAGPLHLWIEIRGSGLRSRGGA
jgi:hypothetical protein